MHNSKVHNLFWVKVFLTNFLHLHVHSYCFNKSYTKSLYKISQIKTIHKNACIKRHRHKTDPYFWTSKVHYYIFGACIYVINFLYRYLKIQVDNVNLITSLTYYWFYGILIKYKCMTLKKIKLHCDIKSEPPYFTVILYLKIEPYNTSVNFTLGL